jgi:hypothetical protein
VQFFVSLIRHVNDVIIKGKNSLYTIQFGLECDLIVSFTADQFWSAWYGMVWYGMVMYVLTKCRVVRYGILHVI